MGLTYPLSPDAAISKLIEDRLVVKSGSRYNIKNSAGLLLAKDLRKFEKLYRKTVRVILYKGNNRLNTIKGFEGHKGYAIGFEGLVNFINDRIPTNEEIGKAFRTEVKMYPEIAIRELVANALIHQDFSIPGTGPMIEIFDNRVEITNPGQPLIDTLRLVDHNPQSRNEHIAFLMRMMRICEERGSGMDKVVNSTEVYQLPPPEFRVEDNFFKVTLFAYKKFKDMDKGDRIMACYLHASLKRLSHEYLTNQSLRERFGINEKNYPMVSRIIADTIEAGLIKDFDPTSSKKFKKYVPFWA